MSGPVFDAHEVERSLRRRNARARRNAQLFDLVFGVRELLRQGKSLGQIVEILGEDPLFDLVPTRRERVIEEWVRYIRRSE
jgi:hypothetical protein